MKVIEFESQDPTGTRQSRVRGAGKNGVIGTASVSTQPPGGTDNAVRGEVQDIAYLGDLSIYLVRLPTGKVVRVTQPNTSRHAEAITWEQQVYLSWDSTSPVVVTR